MKKIIMASLVAVLMIPSLAFASDNSTSSNTLLTDVNIQEVKKTEDNEIKVIEKKSNIVEVERKPEFKKISAPDGTHDKWPAF